MTQDISITADAVEGSWVYRKAPNAWRPYLKLARMDRPVGTWLLLWPCWWGVALASFAPTDPALLALYPLFGLGAIAMRGAGCTYNDIIDRDIDEQVARTASRPIPAGEVSLKQAWLFLLAQCFVGLLVLLTLQFKYSSVSVFLGIGAVFLVLAYPFMKRITWWPQAWLGLTFNWGALMGYAAAAAEPHWAAVALYVGCLFWTLGYDTLYAHQDKEDDALIGVKSSALRLGAATKPAVLCFYALFIAGLSVAGSLAFAGPIYYSGLVLASAHLVWQVWRVNIDEATSCLAVFRSNTSFGWIIFLSLIADNVITF